MQICKPQIGPQLHCMDRGKSIYRLHFKNHYAVDDQVGAKPEWQPDVFKQNRDSTLPNYLAASTPKFVRQCYFINGFK